MTSPVDIRPDHLEIVQGILREHLPVDVKVWVFGSRTNWTTKDSSDLDLALDGESKLSHKLLGALKGAFEDSTLPYTVDVVDLNQIGDSFRQIVESHRAPLSLHRKEVKYPSAGEPEKDWLYHPQFPEHWGRRPLYSMAQWVNGLAFRNIQFSETGMPVIKIAELKGGISGQTKFTEQTFEESVHVIAGDLLFSWSGQPESSIDAFWWRGPEGWLNQHIFRVTPEHNVDEAFFYYLLRYLRPNFVAIARNKQTTGLGHVTKQDLGEIEAALAPLPEQRAIAHVLGTLDDKIELNRRMNETLEAMAWALFKSWFVDFEPVRAKMDGRWHRGESLPGLPAEHYDLFPDRLVDSEIGETPEGWEVKTLGKLVELAYGKALRAIDRKDGPVPVYGSNGQVGWHDKKLVGGPGIVIGRKGNPGVVTWAYGDFFPIDTTFYVVPRDANGGLPFLFFALTVQGLPSVSADSAVPGLNRNLAYMNKQLMPDKHVLAEFNDYASAIFSRQHQLEEECHSLTAQRDALLPQLVAGQIPLSEGGD